MLADLAAVTLALLLSIVILGDGDALFPTSVLAIPLIVVAGKLVGLYDRDELLIHKTTADEAGSLFQLATLYTLVFWLFSDTLLYGDLGKRQALALWTALWVLPLLLRWVARRWVGRTSTRERCLFIGDAETYARLREKLATHGLPVDLVGRLSTRRLLPRLKRHGFAAVDEQAVARLVGDWDVHRVIVSPTGLTAATELEFVRAAKSVGVSVTLVPGTLDVIGSSVVVDDVAGMMLLGTRRFSLNRSSLLVKRSLDLTVSVLAVALLSPLMAIVAIAIKLDSPGPVLFRQTRVGRDGRRFRMLKFRTMVADAEELKAGLASRNEADGLFKIVDDPRITRVGGVLRRTSIDELPQLVNVLAGEMSLVGPRPLVCDEDDAIVGPERKRLMLTPGITGPWQVLGSSRVPLEEMLKIDYRYVTDWSLWLDLRIIIRTAEHMLMRRGM